MVIDLTKSIPLKELCKISAVGYSENAAKWIEFTFSHEAIIGFATELLWMYEDINDNRKLVVCTHPLQADPAPNQVLGFYLTSGSPELTLKVNSLEKTYGEEKEYNHWKEIRIRHKNITQYYEVKAPFDEKEGLITLESYELSGRNLINISLFDDKKNNITQCYSTVTMEINRKGIKDLATMLLVWANNCEEGDEYILPHIDKSNYGYNLGIILDHGSISSKFKYHCLGNVHDYDLEF